MGAPNKQAEVELKKGPWTREEDEKLLAYIQQHGHGNWRNLPAKAGLLRCGKSCRLRWTNYLRPDITRGKFSTQEENTIIRLHALLGNRWAAIAAHLPLRTDNEIKNYWNTRLKKRLTRMGIDPVTHQPKNNPAVSPDQSRLAATLSHMVQWETARLEAEARLARQSKTPSYIRLRHKSTAPPPPPDIDVLRAWKSTATNPSCLLSSNGTLESPTSTLNFFGYSPTVMANDVGSKNGYGALGSGKMENPLQLHDDTSVCYPVGFCDVMTGSMDQGAYNHDSDGYDHLVGDVEGGNKNYWNDLINLVSTPMESPKL